MSRMLPLGRVLRAHGLRGLLRARLEVEDSSWLKPGLKLLVGTKDRELCRFGPAPGGAPNYLIAFTGVDSRESAEELNGLEISIERDQLPELEDEVYIGDLVGLQAFTSDGAELGEVLEVFTLAGRSMLRLHCGLIPLDGPVIESVDFDKGEVTFELPEGLFEAQS